ncbi:MAG TPA: autotransporter-associated beta strand repeat-containing protein, partial [Verrucomicrobiae bacterium]
NLGGLGSGAVTFDGGTLEFNGWTGSTSPDYLGNANALVIPANQTGTVHVPQRFLTPGLAGTLSGGGTLNLMVKYVRGDIPGDWSAFTGKINVLNGSGGDDFRVANANGFPLAKLNIGASVDMYSRAAANSVIPIGEFSGASTATVAADGAGGLGGKNAVTWRVGGLNTDATNAAAFSGIVAFIKEGSGAWTLTGASTHTGSTVVSNGTLLVNGTFNGSPVTVKGGKLGGIGTISGAAVAVNSGGGFAPGNPLGTLTVSNNLTLAAGSTTFVQVQHSPLTNNSAKISGALTEGGTLNVSNIGGAFSNGDSFNLFSAANYSGAFAGFVLPSLTGNLVWNTNTLKNSGTLSVVTLTSPIIAGINLVGGNLIISGSGGVNSWPFYILASTNLMLPTTQWIPVATNQFDAGGNFSVTNAIDPDQPQTFYKLQLQ